MNYTIQESWVFVDEIVAAGCDFTLEYELNREYSETGDYFPCWKCYITQWKDNKKGIPFRAWNNAIDKMEDVWDKNQTASEAIGSAYYRWKRDRL